MEADSDDIATDFGNEQIQITPSYQSNPKVTVKNEEDDKQFEKSLNVEIKKDYIERSNTNLQNEEQKESDDKKIKQVTLNDKNILTKSINKNEDESEYVEANSQTPQEIRGSTNQEYQQQNVKFQKFQVSDRENTQNDSSKQTIDFKQNLQVVQLNQESYFIKQYTSQPQYISKFSTCFKSSTINLNQALDQAQQSKQYFENLKIVLTEPITSMNSQTIFRMDNIKYCVGVGVAIQQILQKHAYDYKSTTSSEMGHGLYIVTSQGYSWSHSQQEDDDAFRQTFNKLYSGVNIKVKLQGQNLLFQWKKGSFSMQLPSRIRQKYTLCFCTYLHAKADAVSIVQQ